jgi:hypothetical protein
LAGSKWPASVEPLLSGAEVPQPRNVCGAHPL